MICKLVGYGKTRQEAIEKTNAALDNYVIRGKFWLWLMSSAFVSVEICVCLIWNEGAPWSKITGLSGIELYEI